MGYHHEDSRMRISDCFDTEKNQALAAIHSQAFPARNNLKYYSEIYWLLCLTFVPLWAIEHFTNHSKKTPWPNLIIISSYTSWSNISIRSSIEPYSHSVWGPIWSSPGTSTMFDGITCTSLHTVVQHLIASYEQHQYGSPPEWGIWRRL